MSTPSVPIHLRYSKFCSDAREMVIIVVEDQEFARKTFDLKTLTFSPHVCKSDYCQVNDYFRKTFEFGNQGLTFRRFHRDAHWNPLMCLAVSWKNEMDGRMDVFCNADGEIGRYVWNEALKCFDRVELFDVRVPSFQQNVRLLLKNPSVMLNNPPVGSDDDLLFCGSQRHQELGEVVFFLFNQKTFRLKQYLFNVDRRQFDKVHLPGLSMSPEQNTTKEIEFRWSTMLLTTRMDAPIQKFRIVGARKIAETAAPIRDICHLDLDEILDRREEQMTITAREDDYLYEGDAEFWFLESGKAMEETLVAGLRGEVISFDEAELMELPRLPTNKKTSGDRSLEQEELDEVKTSDLIPCEWLNRRCYVFSARNTVTGRLEVFKFDTESNVFRQIDWDADWMLRDKSRRHDFGPGFFVKRGKTVTLLKTGTNGRLEVKDYNDFFKGVVREPMRVEMLGEGARKKTTEKRRRLPKKNDASFFCDGFLESLRVEKLGGGAVEKKSRKSTVSFYSHGFLAADGFVRRVSETVWETESEEEEEDVENIPLCQETTEVC